MGRQSVVSVISRYLRMILLWETAVLLATLAISYTIGWRTVPEYANAIVWTGFILVTIGFMTFWGGAGNTQGAEYHHIQSAGGDVHKHIRQTQKDKDAGYSFFTLMAILGIISIVIGSVLESYLNTA